MFAGSFRRCARPVFLVSTVLLVGTGCSTPITGNGAQAVGDPREPRTANQLAALLMDVPPNAIENAEPFDADRTPTFDVFSKGYYGTSGSDHLRGLGVTALAHEGWTASDANAAEVVLFLFANDDAAAAWMTDETAALRDAGALPTTLEDLPSVVGCMFTQYAGGGSQDRRYYAVRGKIGMTFNFYTPPGDGPGEAPQWVGTQYRQLS